MTCLRSHSPQVVQAGLLCIHPVSALISMLWDYMSTASPSKHEPLGKQGLCLFVSVPWHLGNHTGAGGGQGHSIPGPSHEALSRPRDVAWHVVSQQEAGFQPRFQGGRDSPHHRDFICVSLTSPVIAHADIICPST